MTKMIAVFLLVAVPVTSLFANDPHELQTAKERFRRLSRPTETDRQHFIAGLMDLRFTFAEARRTRDWQAVDTEIRRHPAPKTSDSTALSKILVGEWASLRHEYLFRANGNWTMLPDVIDGFKSTHGSWRIERNQYFATAEIDPNVTQRYTIILLTAQDFIFTDEKVVFYRTRITKAK